MTALDFEANEYDLGVTSVRLIRVADVVQIIFSEKLAAQLFYAGAAARFKKDEEDWRSK